MIKLVAFDWNGTILADTIICLEAANLVLQNMNHRPITLREYQETATIPIVDFYIRHGFDREEFFMAAEENDKIFHGHYESRIIKARTRIGARATLVWLKEHGIKSAIFSNHTLTGIENQIKRLRLEGLFEDIMANSNSLTPLSEKNKETKVKNHIKKLGLKKGEVMIVGDSPEEIEIGKRLGLVTVAIKDGTYSIKRLLQEKPDYLIGSLKELTEIVDAINKRII